LQILLPEISDEKVAAFATKSLDKAISLRYGITQEQAIYRCFMAESGKHFDDSWLKVAEGEKMGGKVLMCTFPGLNRIILQDGMPTYVGVVKASVKLEEMLTMRESEENFGGEIEPGKDPANVSRRRRDQTKKAKTRKRDRRGEVTSTLSEEKFSKRARGAPKQDVETQQFEKNRPTVILVE
jgi:hypothetical protein